MSNRFKTRKKVPLFRYLKITVFIIILIFLVVKLINFFFMFVNDEMTKKLLFNYVINDYDHYNQNIINKTISYTSSNLINNPNQMIKTSIVYEWNDDTDGELIDAYIENPNEESNIIKSDPLVYIYNSHQGEKYVQTDEEVEPTVLLASYMLQKSLLNLNINSVVEEQNITEFMRINNMQYYQSYEASRYYLEDAINDYPTIKLYIDLHRDAGSHDNYTININDKDYAKVMFIVGKENPNYLDNLGVIEILNDKINSQYHELSKGILEKEGEGVNGIYNQDVSSNVILIELGCNKNNMNEVNNTIEILSQVIGDYVNE